MYLELVVPMSIISAYDCCDATKSIGEESLNLYTYENRSKSEISACGWVIAFNEMTLPYLACWQDEIA